MSSIASVVVLVGVLIGPFTAVGGAAAASTPADRLYDVSCPAPSQCIAVGQGGPNEDPMVEVRANTTWTAVIPQPADAPIDQVSCTSMTSCLGGAFSSAGAVVDELQGSQWSSVTASGTVGGGANQVTDISCAGSGGTHCMGVGTWAGEVISGIFGSFAVQRTSARSGWVVLPTPNPDTADGLGSVSCPTVSMCIAVGAHWAGTDQPRFPLADQWDGHRWTEMSTPSSAGGSTLDAVSCPSPTSCIAVGANGGGGPLVEHWNGAYWTFAAVPSIAGMLDDVACPTTSMCLAVGSGPSTAIALEWNGGRWTSELPPVPSGSTSDTLAGVDCTNASRCTTVGYANGSAGTVTLAERWRLGTFAIMRTVNP